jgi:diguanylate cyclase (GGDEF)-like protein/PAS domain S-box-containing protein
VDPRRWWLLTGVVPVAIACVLAAGNPALRPLGDLAVVVSGLCAAAILWIVGGRRGHRRSSWRLLGIAPLLPVVGTLTAAVMAPLDPAQSVIVRWVPTVPGYVLATAAILTLVEPARLRAGGLRLAVELALFSTAALVVVQLLVIGPTGPWGGLAASAKLVLGAAVVVTSATMAAALTLLSVVEAHRRRMALVLLVGAVALTGGRGLATSALLAGAPALVDASRLLVVAGLWLLAAAVLTEAGPRIESGEDSTSRRTADLGQLLPHLAMLVAVTVVAGFAVSGWEPTPFAVVGILVSVALAAVHRWVTARDGRRMAALLRRSEAYFRSLVRSSGDAVVIVDHDLRISWTSTALDRALGSATADLVGRLLLETVHPDDARSLADVLAAAPTAQDAGTGLLLLRLQDADGVWRVLEAGVSDLRQDPAVGALVLHCRDMTDRHAREQALQSVAYTDPKTGLPNRAGLEQALRARVSTDGLAPATLVVISLDRIVAVREQVGREVVSTVMSEMGRRLRATVRAEDLVSRMGGGAFALLVEGSGDEVDQLAARCHSVVERPFLTTAGIIDLTAGVGVAELEPGVDVETLLGRADLAVRVASAMGVGCTARFGPEMGAAAARQEQLRTEMSGACARGEFSLLLQPVASLGEQRITGIEAKVRWRHPLLGEVLPSEFLPIAESAGLIGELQRWVFEEAMTATASLPSTGAPLRVGINVSPGYLRTGLLVSDVEAALVRSGLGAERVILEIGEDAFGSREERIRLDLDTLRLMGVHVALDGFGTGDSALAHLTRLPFDVLKLDRSLITRLDRDRRSRAYCESIVGIGLALGLDVVAQGVETTAQLAALDGFGCGFAQGFLISRPMRLPELVEMLSQNPDALLPRLVGAR